METCTVCDQDFEPVTHNQRYCSRTCYRKQENERYRNQEEIALCPKCGEFFTRPRGRTHRVYCSEGCHVEAKHERFVGLDVGKQMISSCPHGTDNVAICPACTFLVRAERAGHIGLRQLIRRDPCSYCGKRGGTVDHVEPTCRGGVNDWSNLTGACHRCNSTKGMLGSILISLIWVRAANEYHDLRRTLFV